MKVGALFLLLNAININWSVGEEFNLLILHNNDMHARFEETSQTSGTCKEADKNKNCYGGFARVAHVVKEARRKAEDGSGPKVLYLNAGDTYTGTVWYSVYRWTIVSELMNLLKPDAMCLGNHEFDDKVEGIVPFINAANFPIVAANLDFSKEPQLAKSKVAKSFVTEISGHKIGIVGYLTPDTVFISSPEDVIFKNEIESLKEETEKLDKAGVKIILALGHSGYLIDKQIAKEVPLVDAVIGGHTNTFLWNGEKPDLETPKDGYPTIVEQTSGKKVPVVQAYAFTKYMGNLTLTFDGHGMLMQLDGQPILLNSSIPQDQEILQVLEKYREKKDALSDRVVGQTKVSLEGSDVTCRTRECNTGNLITDAYVAYHSRFYGGSYWTDAPIAMVNGGTIRTNVEPYLAGGNITGGDLMELMPFYNQVLSLNLNGTDLMKTLELSVRSNGETSRGEFLQLSGLRVTYDLSKPTGSRVVEAEARCGACRVPTYKPIMENQTYRVLMDSFMAEGGDGYFNVKENAYNKVVEDLNDRDIVSWYIERRSPIYPELENRIRVKNSDDE